MNAKTLEAVRRHGLSLLAAFPNATETDPVALCKKLRRIETAIAPILLRNCNERVPEAELDAATDKAQERVTKLLGGYRGACGIFVNRDPRGYALKFSEKWTREYNQKQYAKDGRCGLPIYTDWGGYGIIAPDLTVEERVSA